MLLFTRQAIIRPGRLVRAMAFVNDITAYAADKIGQEISCDIVTFGAPQGMVVWATGYEDIAAWAAANDILMAEQEYLERIDGAGDLWLAGSLRDTLRQEVANHGLDRAHPFTMFNTSTPAPGKVQAATEWGADMASYAHGVTGQPISFYSDMFGRFGQVSWLSGYPDAQAATDGTAKLRSDPGYLERLVRAGSDGLFIPGSGRASMSRRLV